MLIKESGIYKILNIVTEDFYEGSAVCIGIRWRRHCYELCKNIHGNEHLQRAWNKYGEDNFEFSVLELCEKELLLVREQWYFDNDHPAYNINPVAGSSLGTKRSDATRARMSEAQKGNTNNLGHIATAETRAKIGVANKGKPGGMFGKHHTEETLAKISVANTGKHRTEESCARMSVAHKSKPDARLGKHHSEETLAKMRSAAKNRLPISEVTRAKLSIASKRAWALKREAQND